MPSPEIQQRNIALHPTHPATLLQTFQEVFMPIGTLNLVSAFLWAIVLFFFAAELLHYLWNLTMPQIFSLKVITYWQAFRLLIIAALLTSGGLIHLTLGH